MRISAGPGTTKMGAGGGEGKKRGESIYRGNRGVGGRGRKGGLIYAILQHSRLCSLHREQRWSSLKYGCRKKRGSKIKSGEAA